MLDIYNEHKEPIGFEGRARVELIKQAIARGFLHIRLHVNRFWAINLWDYDSRAQKALLTWAEEAKDDPMAGRQMPVRILELKTENIITTIAQHLLFAQEHEDEKLKTFNPHFVDSVDEFESLTQFR